MQSKASAEIPHPPPDRAGQKRSCVKGARRESFIGVSPATLVMREALPIGSQTPLTARQGFRRQQIAAELLGEIRIAMEGDAVVSTVGNVNPAQRQARLEDRRLGAFVITPVLNCVAAQFVRIPAAPVRAPDQCRIK